MTHADIERLARESGGSVMFPAVPGVCAAECVMTTADLQRFASALRALHMEEAAEACERFGATLEADVGTNFAEEVRALKSAP